VWIALKYAPDWRWMLDVTRQPLYPTARLFRQTRAAIGAGVLIVSADALISRVAAI